MERGFEQNVLPMGFRRLLRISRFIISGGLTQLPTGIAKPLLQFAVMRGALVISFDVFAQSRIASVIRFCKRKRYLNASEIAR